MFLATVVVTTLIICLYLLKEKLKSRLKGFPEPTANLIFGHGLQIASTTKVLEVTSQYLKTKGTIVKVRLGPACAPLREALLTTDYKFTEFVLSSNKILAKSENYLYLKPWLGQGLLITDGAHWKEHRKILTPAFHFEILKEFIAIFQTVGNTLVEKLGKYDGVASVNLQPLVTLCTLDVICETAMGTKINAQSGDNTQYVESVREMCRIIMDRLLSPIGVFDHTFWLSRDYYKQKKALTVLHEFTMKVMASKKMYQNSKKSGKKMAFLDLLLNLNVMNDNEIREEVDTFMFAGHDTTSSGICFTLYCLANNSEVQNKVLQEQKEMFGNEKNPMITLIELQNMKYLERVIKETFRLYPPVPVLGRYTKENMEFGGRLIPKNTNIVISVYNIHRNPEYFPDPEKFDPDRFERSDSSFPYAYIPFSAGPRNCIGQKFAMLEVKSIISKVIRHFEITPANPKEELILSVEAVLKSANGVKVGLRKRN